MTLYAFTSGKPMLAARELEKYGGFCIVRQNRRHQSAPVDHERRHRYRGKGKASFKPIEEPTFVPAIEGYVFAYNPDPWKVSKMKHVRKALSFTAGGFWQPVPTHEARWLENPPRGLYKSTDVPRFRSSVPPPIVKPGDTIRFEMACEMMETQVLEVCDGNDLLVAIQLLGREVKTRIPLSMVEAA
jgi:hypothetical protein